MLISLAFPPFDAARAVPAAKNNIAHTSAIMMLRFIRPSQILCDFLSGRILLRADAVPRHLRAYVGGLAQARDRMTISRHRLPAEDTSSDTISVISKSKRRLLNWKADRRRKMPLRLNAYS